MSFAKASIETFVTRIFSIILSVITGIIQARVLGPDGVGVLTLLLLINTFAFRAGNLGLGSSFSYFLANRKVSLRHSIQAMWLVSTIVSVLCVLFLILFRDNRYSPWRDTAPLYFYLFLPTVFLYFLINFLQSILSGKLKIRERNVSLTLSFFANFALTAFFLLVLKSGMTGAIIACVLTDIVTVAYLLVKTKQLPEEIIPETAETFRAGLKHMFSYGKWNYYLMFINWALETAPLLILKNYGTDAAVGLYARARGLADKSQIVAQPVAQVLFPYTAFCARDESTRRTNILCRNVFLIMIPLSIFMFFIAKPLIVLLYGRDFIAAAGIFYMLIPGVMVWTSGHFLGVHIAAAGHAKAAFYCSLLSLLVSFPICIGLTVKWGMNGAGLGATAIFLLLYLFRLTVYVRLMNTTFAEVILPQRDDIEIYKRVCNAMLAKVHNYKICRKD